MSKTKNLGQVSGVFIGKSEPKNTSLIWYDDTPSQMCHKVYDSVTNSWKALSPDIVSNTTYSELVSNAQKNGLSVGKHYIITDKSNVLAIAITATKVQYPDSLGNILIDDLGTNIQYHVSGSNLLIDDLSGVFNVQSNKLVFQFKEQDSIDIDTDYLFGKVRSGTKWVLSKFKFSALISNKVNNVISWSNGLFFSFKDAINAIINKEGGLVGFDEYDSKISQINQSIENVSKNNQEIVSNAEKTIIENTTDVKIYGKKIPNNIETATAPSDVIKGDTLLTIISKFQRWINRFKYATGISLSKNFSDAKNQQYVNNSDTVESALSKIQYTLKHIVEVCKLPSDWKSDEVYENNGFPNAEDTLYITFAKIVDFLKHSLEYIKIPSGWSSTSDIGLKPDHGYSILEDDSISTCLKKLLLNTTKITHGQMQPRSVSFDNLYHEGVYPSDIIRFDFSVADSSWFPAGCGIGGVVSMNQSSHDNFSYPLDYDSRNYPNDPYRLRFGTYSSSYGYIEWPQVVAFLPVVYFYDNAANSKKLWTNANSLIHVNNEISIQYIIYLTDVALTALRSKGTKVTIRYSADIYGSKTQDYETVKSLEQNILQLNFNVSKSRMETNYNKCKDIIISVSIISVS